MNLLGNNEDTMIIVLGGEKIQRSVNEKICKRRNERCYKKSEFMVPFKIVSSCSLETGKIICGCPEGIDVGASIY